MLNGTAFITFSQPGEALLPTCNDVIIYDVLSVLLLLLNR